MGKKSSRDVQASYWALRNYVDARLGNIKGPYAYAFLRVCKALKCDGKVRPREVSPRAWIAKNLPYIISEGKKVPRQIDGADFLESFAWRKVRMLALKKYGARCLCCGATPATGAVMNVDHIKPRKLFPELALDLNNLQILCHECNHGKGNWDQTDWRSPTKEAS